MGHAAGNRCQGPGPGLSGFAESRPGNTRPDHGVHEKDPGTAQAVRYKTEPAQKLFPGRAQVQGNPGRIRHAERILQAGTHQQPGSGRTSEHFTHNIPQVVPNHSAYGIKESNHFERGNA